MQPKPASVATVDSDQVLTVRLLDRSDTPRAVQPPAPPMPPGLLLRLLDPPKVKVRRRDLPDVLRPAYEALPGL